MSLCINLFQSQKFINVVWFYFKSISLQDPSWLSPQIPTQQNTKDNQDLTENDNYTVIIGTQAEALMETVTHAPAPSQNHTAPSLPTVIQAADVGPMSQKTSFLSKYKISRITKGKKDSKHDLDTPARAQSVTRSRLEKARCRVQGRIQQVIKLFGDKEISGAKAKRKQVQFED